MVANAHAIIHPGTVVIHLDNASLANTAMMSSCRLECIAPPTKLTHTLARAYPCAITGQRVLALFQGNGTICPPIFNQTFLVWQR